MMMRAGFSIGMNRHGSSPNLLGADAGEIDRGFAVHARCLSRIRIEIVPWHDAHAIVFPI
jgi:hypothetical protein